MQLPFFFNRIISIHRELTTLTRAFIIDNCRVKTTKKASMIVTGLINIFNKGPSIRKGK